METSERISLAAIMMIALALLNQPARAEGLLPPPPPPTAFPAARGMPGGAELLILLRQRTQADLLSINLPFEGCGRWLEVLPCT